MPGAGGAAGSGGEDAITKSWDVIQQFQALNNRGSFGGGGSSGAVAALRRQGSSKGEGGGGGQQGGGGGVPEPAKGAASAIKDELESKSAYMKQVCPCRGAHPRVRPCVRPCEAYCFVETCPKRLVLWPL